MSSRSRSDKWLRRALITASILALGAGCLWWKQDDLRILLHVDLSTRNLPPFNASKAAALSPERRAELERKLFTELPMWNTQSRRYVEPNGRLEREQRWQQMADEGYELAHLVLQVFQPTQVSVHDPRPTLKRLEALAQQGDAGAMCLIARLINQLPYGAINGSSRMLRIQKQWMQKGADLGHPQCLTDLGLRLKAGTDGWPHDNVRGSEMLFQAMRQGHPIGAGSFWIEFEDRGLSSPINRKGAYCWQYQSAKYGSYAADQALRYYARYQAPAEQREHLEEELRQLRQWHPSVEDCIRLSKEK